jgi:hypothetical protein
MRQFVFGAAIAAVVGIPPTAINALTMQGIPNCADWLQLRSSGRAVEATAWLLGFLSGVSLGTGKEFWDVPTKAIAPNQAYLWMDNYCQGNPLSNTGEGATALFRQVTGY